MKKYIYFSFVFLLLLFFGSYYFGCNKENPVNNGTTGTVTSIQTNGSILQVSRTNATGTMIVADQNGGAITGITNANVTAYLRWPARADSVAGTVTVSSNSGSGKNVAGVATMDYSGSMGSAQIDCMQQGVKAYINKMGSNDLTEIIKFDDQVIVAQTFTSNKPMLLHAVDSTFNLGGSTALYQSIYNGIQDVSTYNSSQYTKCVIAFTDGGENASTVSRATMIAQALSSAIPIYTIGLYPDTISYSSYSKDLRNIADTTGGFYFWAKPDSTCSSSLSGVYNIISGQIANSYSLNIVWPSSALPAAGTIVRVTIIVNYNGLIGSFSRSYAIM